MSELHIADNLNDKKRGLSLPPWDAWKDPYKWLGTDTPPRIHTPVNDNNIPLRDVTVEIIAEQFRDDYDWPVIPDEPETKSDIHHIAFHSWQYEPQFHAGHTFPKRYRNQWSLLAVLPGLAHNAAHQKILLPQQEMPSHDQMLKSLDSNYIHEDLDNWSEQTYKSQRQFTTRRALVESKPSILGFDTNEEGQLIDKNGEVVEEIDDKNGHRCLVDRHMLHYNKFSEAVMRAAFLDSAFYLVPNLDMLVKEKPNVIAKELASRGVAEMVQLKSYVSWFRQEESSQAA